MNFDPEAYSITIRKEVIDDEVLYVGRVSEFPNISAFEDTYDEAHSLVLDAITRLHSFADEKGVAFPAPNPSIPDEFSGRITLRLPKSLHAKVVQYADREDVSLNTYLVSAISTYAGEMKGMERTTEKIGQYFQQYLHAEWVRSATSTTSAKTLMDPLKYQNIYSLEVGQSRREAHTNDWFSFRNIKKFDQQVTA